jgi:nitrogen fixation NifU-like protein
MNEFDQMYREVILDHYKNPRGHGELDHADAQAEGQISQAATSMLMEMTQGRSATEVASLPREELLDELGIPLSPVRLKCALLGLSTLKLALHKAKGTPLPEEWAGAAGDLDLK